MSFQVIRKETFTLGSLYGVGGEAERTRENQPNPDIDKERSHLNYYYKKTEAGLANEWRKVMDELQATFKNSKTKNHKQATAYEGWVITATNDFFEKHGFVRGEPIAPKVKEYFDEAYAFAVRQIGYNGTDANILSAVVHLDETTPHMQLYYIPLVDTARKKVYARDADGKVIKVKNAKGSGVHPLQARDENGNALFNRVELEHPNVCTSDFWEQRGGKNCLVNLQDNFYAEVAQHWGLERGEKGSNKEHRTKAQHEREELEKEKAALEKQYKELQDQIVQKNAYLAEIRQAAEDAKSGKKAGLFGKDKQIEGLRLENKELTEQIASRDRDNELIFKQMREAEQERDKLRPAAERYNTIQTYAPEALKDAERQADYNLKHSANRSTYNNNNRGGWSSR